MASPHDSNSNSPFVSLKNWWRNVASPGINQLWNDYTGQSAVEKQNAAQLELAKYQTQMQEDFYNKYSSPEALMRQYKEAGLNPNLVYGSASAGQSNVPSFSAPQVNRNIAGGDKINKALSLLSGISGVATGIYQAAAAREAAEQSSIKTISDSLSLRSQHRNFWKEGVLFNTNHFYDPKAKRSRNYWEFLSNPNFDYYLSQDSVGARYLRAYRQNEFNRLAAPVLNNVADFGVNIGDQGIWKLDNYFGQPYYRTRNAQNHLRYRLQNELGNLGTYGKLAVSLLGTLF